MQKAKYHLTQSLLSAWLYGLKSEEGYESFLKSLRREKIPETEAMRNGIQFENLVNGVLNGAYLPQDCKWYKGVMATSQYLHGTIQQVNIYRDIEVEGITFTLNGRLDFLGHGIIYDTKFTQNYHLNKYLGSPQHPMYFYLCPDAYEFQYLACDGKFVYREIYRPEDVTPIEITIKQFMDFLDRQNLIELYTSVWDTDVIYKKKEN